MRRIIALAVAAALAAGACSESASDPTVVTTVTSSTSTTIGEGAIDAIAGRFDPSEIRFVAALERLDTCDAVLEYFQAEALARVGPYGLSQGSIYPPIVLEEARAEDAAGEAVATTLAPPAGAPIEGTDYSGTNVQVAGVDEPDIVKTDGTRILVVIDGVLTYVDLSGGGPRVLGRLTLDTGWNHTLLVNGDRAFVFSGGSGFDGIPEALIASEILPPYDGDVTLIQEVDLSDPASIRVERTLRVEGRFLSARLVGGTVRVVVDSYPDDLPFVYPSGPSAEEFAGQANREVVLRSTIEDWLPTFSLFAGGQMVAEGLAVECEQVHRPAEFAGFDTLSVLTLDFAAGLSGGLGTAVVARGETVYASTDSLYVATNVWVPEELIGAAELEPLEESYSTAIHQFDISGNGPASYLASGSVAGHLLNQFSMDEYQGVLRVATTDGAPWWPGEDSESAVVTLQRQGDRLVQIGRVGDLGRGERIFAVRFMGDTGFVVTFRQTDPLYVIDLGDPASPAVTGELKIPGYSAYLHPIGGGRLLGVGQEATEEGWTTGAKVSLFDVSNPTNPIELDTWMLPGGWTDVEWDHHAFLYWAPLELAVLPVQSWEDGFFGAVILQTGATLEEIGRITHAAEGWTDPGCRPLEIPDEYRDEYLEDGIYVQICGVEDVGGRQGYWCDSIPSEEVALVADEVPFDLGIGEDERVEVCWPEYGPTNPPIQRSLVVGDVLWTLSWQWLQGNALPGLDVFHQIPLG